MYPENDEDGGGDERRCGDRQAGVGDDAGSVVMEAISNGPAAMVAPSPMLETAEAVQSLVKSAPRRVETRARKIAPRARGNGRCVSDRFAARSTTS